MTRGCRRYLMISRHEGSSVVGIWEIVGRVAHRLASMIAQHVVASSCIVSVRQISIQRCDILVRIMRAVSDKDTGNIPKAVDIRSKPMVACWSASRCLQDKAPPQQVQHADGILPTWRRSICKDRRAQNGRTSTHTRNLVQYQCSVARDGSPYH